MPHCHWPPWSFSTFIFLLFLFLFLLLNPQSSTCCSIPTNQTLVNSPFLSFPTSLPGPHSRQLGLNNTFIKASPKRKLNVTELLHSYFHFTLFYQLHSPLLFASRSLQLWRYCGCFVLHSESFCTKVPFLSFRILKSQVPANVNLKMKSDNHKMGFVQGGSVSHLTGLTIFLQRHFVLLFPSKARK